MKDFKENGLNTLNEYAKIYKMSKKEYSLEYLRYEM